ncbi:hypothetical protein E3P86_02041 [Wallemia ichthyophaga]|uniref:HMG box domain-containing protein n=1 Tax=Wallemia ichthyophaga TaxID=245174 RepID=A0A4V4M5M4_WALIC|nr:hypothetical protein E3P86_02041 [Wallemia ichthyophaga]
MSSLVSRIHAYQKNKNLYSSLSDKIRHLTPPINTKLTGYMLFLKQNKLDVKVAAERWSQLDAESKHRYIQQASTLPPINSRGTINKHDYKLIRSMQFELLDEFHQKHPLKHPPTRLRPNVYPRHQRSPPTPWQLFISEFKPVQSNHPTTTQQSFSNHLKQASHRWKHLSNDMKSRYLSKANLNKSRHVIEESKKGENFTP